MIENSNCLVFLFHVINERVVRVTLEILTIIFFNQNCRLPVK